MLKQPSSEYRGYRAAGIRLREEMLPHLSKLSAGRIRPMLAALHAFDKAHAVMLMEEKLLGREAGVAILRALREMEREGVEAVRARVGGGLHSGEQYLIRRLGEDIGGRLHVGRSSGDLSSVAINTARRMPSQRRREKPSGWTSVRRTTKSVSGAEDMAWRTQRTSPTIVRSRSRGALV